MCQRYAINVWLFLIPKTRYNFTLLRLPTRDVFLRLNEMMKDKRLFAVKRKEQIKTAEQVWRVDNYEKQYKTIKFLMETIFPVRWYLGVECSLFTLAHLNDRF